LENLFLKKNISLYPNPVINNITIDIAKGGKVSAVKVYNVLGEILINQAVNNLSKYELNITELESGIYFLEIHTGKDGIVIKKLNKI